MRLDSRFRGNDNYFSMFPKSIRYKPAGFTLVELLLAVTLITVLSGITIPLYQSFQVKNDLDIAAQTFVENIKRAQLLSQSVQGDSSWGVKFQSGSIVIFKGADFSGRDQNYDEVYGVSPEISISGSGTIISSGTAEDVFEKMSGKSLMTGTVTLTSSNGDSKNIVVNEKGMAEY